MKIVLAPNAFKGSIGGQEAAAAMKNGIGRIDPDINVVCIPVTDGGDGLVEILTTTLDGTILSEKVTGPRFKEIDAVFGYEKRSATGIVEMAKASGLVLLKDQQRNPLKTTTYGTGELVRCCLDRKVDKIVIGLGGSATCDGGIGAAAALGYRFLDKYGNELEPTGESLISIASIDCSNVDKRIKETNVEAVCDVDNPLFGINGASYVYSPQKGADEDQVRLLDEGLRNLAQVIQKDLGVNVAEIPGAGAAGGLGAGVHCFLDGRLRKGIELMLDMLGAREQIRSADLVITGEGAIDYQTKFDKAPAGVAKEAKASGVPCVAICGSVGEKIDELHEVGFDAVFSLCKGPVSLEKAMMDGKVLLADAAEQAVRLFLAAKRDKVLRQNS